MESSDGPARLGLPPPVQQLGGAVLVQGREGLDQLAKCVLAAMREMQRNGYAPPPSLADLLIKAHAARTMSQPRHEFASYQVVESHSEGQDVEDDWIDVAEAAQALGVGVRQMQRLARNLSPGGVKHFGSSWALRKAPVLAQAEERKRKGGR